MNKVQKLKNNLFTKFVITISILLISFFLITVTLLLQVVENSILDEVEKGAEKLTRSIAMISAPHISNYTFMFLEQNTIQLQNGEKDQLDILSVQIFDNNGYKLNLSGIDTANIQTPRKYWLIKNAPCFIKDFHGTEERVGYVRIVFSLKSSIVKILKIRFLIILAVVLIILLLDFLVILLLSRSVIKPINSLKDAATMISERSFDVSFDKIPNDELGFLMRSFQQMAQDLKNSFSTIQHQYRQLQIDHDEIKKNEETLTHLNQCFLDMSANPDENLNMIAQTAGELLHGGFVLYNRFEESKNLLCTRGFWNAPKDLNLISTPENRLCFEVIRNNDGRVIIIEDMQEHKFWEVDKNLKKYNVMSYIGVPVTLNNQVIGCFCLCDHNVRTFKPEEINVMVILAQAVKNEEERRSYARELKETRNYLRNVFNSLSSSLITLNEKFAITEWNSEAEKVFGFSQNQKDVRFFWEINPAFENHRQRIMDAIQRMEHFVMHQVVIKFEDTRYFDMYVVPLLVGNSRGAVIRLDDVTNMIKKDNQLFQAQKMETVGNLAGGLAHDFNNVLCGITATISLLKYYLDMKNIDDSQIVKYINTMEQSSNRASEMVQQLLTLSRRQEVSYDTVKLSDAIHNVTEICKNTLDKSIDLIVGDITDEAYINANQTQIEQVLLNLCVNSSHAMTIMRENHEKKGGKLKISLSKYLVEKSFSAYHPDSKEGYYWVLSVRDEGVGMNNEVLRRIFDPFFTTKDSSHGTGLGLAMVYNIIKMHNGFINVYSEEGVGSTFQVYLPVLSNQDERNQEKTVTGSLVKGEGRILVVDDEEHIRQISENILLESGYEVFTAENGLEALLVLGDVKNIDLVLLDLSMPVMSGKEAFNRIKELYPDMRVILTSGFRQDKRVSDIMNAGADYFIQKPFTMETITSAVFSVLINSKPGNKEV